MKNVEYFFELLYIFFFEPEKGRPISLRTLHHFSEIKVLTKYIIIDFKFYN